MSTIHRHTNTQFCILRHNCEIRRSKDYYSYFISKYHYKRYIYMEGRYEIKIKTAIGDNII